MLERQEERQRGKWRDKEASGETKRQVDKQRGKWRGREARGERYPLCFGVPFKCKKQSSSKKNEFPYFNATTPFLSRQARFPEATDRQQTDRVLFDACMCVPKCPGFKMDDLNSVVTTPI
ncbi:hypothetical protein LSTR_LSTR005367 [Laodelphax striatellus]|uniref:Uncharacterized protein n=1 Tax=Laodelphax striatellus TaxID=195883 RepID=A0A482WQZ6_LAOST|nr:hypothetical protein LSTR_LSTR005367 [Laodelphax striatellus]